MKGSPKRRKGCFVREERYREARVELEELGRKRRERKIAI
jgi:hypothetical protein